MKKESRAVYTAFFSVPYARIKYLVSSIGTYPNGCGYDETPQPSGIPYNLRRFSNEMIIFFVSFSSFLLHIFHTLLYATETKFY